jgi:hypothetical protein
MCSLGIRIDRALRTAMIVRILDGRVDNSRCGSSMESFRREIES